MTIVKTPEQLGRAPLAYALTLAMIYALGEICFWVCIAATNLAYCLLLLIERDKMRDPRRNKWLFVSLGSSSLLFYGYMIIRHPYIFVGIGPSADSANIASFDGVQLDQGTTRVSVLAVMALLGAAPLALIGLLMLGVLGAFKALANWLLVRAGRHRLF